MVMSQFHPTNITVEPPPAPDYLAGSVLQALSRPIGAKLSWGVIRSFILGFATFGFLPIISWVRGFHRFATAEQQQFLHLAQWVRLNSDHPLARRLESDASELRPRGVLSVLTFLTAIATAVGIGVLVSQTRYNRFDVLVGGTYGVNNTRAVIYHLPVFRRSPMIFKLWVYGLGTAYLLHFLQICLHAQDVKRFVARFSEIAQSEGINRVKADSLGILLQPFWLAAGVFLFLFNAPWGVVAVLAGGAQRRYITWTSRSTRSDVGQRLRAMLLRRRPATGLPVSVYQRDRCIGPLCRAEMPRGVNFCPRCGTRQRPQVNRVA
jgi:hypothetical protein